MGCCECHDHKFDPFSTKDFYSMEAFFADLKQWGVYSDYSYTPNPDLKGWSNDHPFPPEIEVRSPYLVKRVEKLRNRLLDVAEASAARRATEEQNRAAFGEWVLEMSTFLGKHASGWVT